jgi:hypothetical protein
MRKWTDERKKVLWVRIRAAGIIIFSYFFQMESYFDLVKFVMVCLVYSFV